MCRFLRLCDWLFGWVLVDLWAGQRGLTKFLRRCENFFAGWLCCIPERPRVTSRMRTILDGPEPLEARVLLDAYFWTGAVNAQYSNTGNWYDANVKGGKASTYPGENNVTTDVVVFDKAHLATNNMGGIIAKQTCIVDVPVTLAGLAFDPSLKRTITLTVNKPLTVAGTDLNAYFMTNTSFTANFDLLNGSDAKFDRIDGTSTLTVNTSAALGLGTLAGSGKTVFGGPVDWFTNPTKDAYLMLNHHTIEFTASAKPIRILRGVGIKMDQSTILNASPSFLYRVCSINGDFRKMKYGTTILSQ